MFFDGTNLESDRSAICAKRRPYEIKEADNQKTDEGGSESDTQHRAQHIKACTQDSVESSPKDCQSNHAASLFGSFPPHSVQNLALELFGA